MAILQQCYVYVSAKLFCGAKMSVAFVLLLFELLFGLTLPLIEASNLIDKITTDASVLCKEREAAMACQQVLASTDPKHKFQDTMLTRTRGLQ